jgi:NAD(P) transhydrogenase subunit alpha
MTAAGRIDAARVLILGAGVAGLQAIGIARRLGAIVEAYDVRAAVKEQVESLGAKFVDVDVQADGEGKGGYAKEVSADTQQRVNEIIAQHLSEPTCASRRRSFRDVPRRACSPRTWSGG